MDKKIFVKDQFNKQAEKFSSWAITKNIEYLERYFEFCGIVQEDKLLDIACGSGEFSIFCAKRINSVVGIDISDRMIELAKKQAIANNLKNIQFKCYDAGSIPFEDNTFSVVISKSAFHHFNIYENIFIEMIRCCKKGGKVSIQDIVSYDDKRVNKYFERIEKEIDRSHNKTLLKEELVSLFVIHNIKVLRTYGVEIELNFNEYINHAVQCKTNLKNIDVLLDWCLRDKEISQYFTTINGDLFFKRNVFLILGIKP